jgi:hypothetical protein
MPDAYFVLGDPEGVAPPDSAELGIRWSLGIPEQTEPGRPGSVGVGDIVNALRWFWDLIKENEPVVNVKEPPHAEALPKEAERWDVLERWQGPRAFAYPLKIRNLMGMPVVQLVHEVQYFWGGTFDGKGRYLKNVTVETKFVKVWPGYTVDAGARILQVVNFATRGDPLAGLQLTVAQTIRTKLSHMTVGKTFVVRGDGTHYEVAASSARGLRR